jgi:hypothetical protein
MIRFVARRRWLLERLGVVGLLVVALAACGSTEPYRKALGELALPDSWELLHERAGAGMSFCLNCAYAFRYYTAPGDLPDLLAVAEEAIRAAGYSDVFVASPLCDRNTNGALCSITARSDEVLLIVGVYPPGDDVDHLGLARADQAVVRFNAQAP